MKRMTATVLMIAALSTPALAETPNDREMHSWDYVQTVAYPPAQTQAPVIEHHEQRPYYHHEGEKGKHHMKGHGHKKHEGKTAGKHAHHHHHHKKMDSKVKDTPAAQPKQ